MFSEPETPILCMIQRAAKIYKNYYGEYPESVGLDIFTRFKEWQQTSHLDAYHFREMAYPIHLVLRPDTMLTYTNIAIKVYPATFDEIQYDAWGLNPRPKDPTRGRDEIWCKCGDHEVLMHLLFSKNGWHATVWEKKDNQLR